jgi:hypothetical protein
MDPIYLGHTQCFNVDEQCFVGEDQKHRLDTNQTLKQAFIDGCKANNPKNAELRCCPLSLMNKPYFPTAGKVPVHVKEISNNEFKMCPESIQSDCIREKNPQAFILCVAQKCNDAGYLEAYNYYQICKAYKEQGDIQSVPDCPTATCAKMMKLPKWYNDQLTGSQTTTAKSSEDNKLTKCNPLYVAVPADKPYYDGKEITLKYLYSLLPRENDFYNWSAVILGIITMALILLVGFLQR